MQSYSVFGLPVCANRPIPHLVASSDHSFQRSAAVLRVSFGRNTGPLSHPPLGTKPLYESPDSLEGRGPTMTVRRCDTTGAYHVALAFGTRFWIDRAGTAVDASWGNGAGFEDACHDLLGPVLGLVLHLRGIACLHASAVLIDGGAVGLLGRRGAGKSTTAVGFAASGYAVVSDDVVALSAEQGRLMAEPAYPRLHVWQDSADAFASSFGGLTPVTPTWNKWAVDLRARGVPFVDRAKPLAAIYALDGRSASIDTPQITPIRGRRALMSLVEHTYVGYLLDDAMRGSALKSLGQLASRVPLFAVMAPDGLQYVDSLCAGIADHHRSTIAKAA